MIWAHRGFTEGYPENSLESFDAAKRMGYYGIELDIHFLEEKGFIVAHDIPQKRRNNESYLLLETVFKRYRNQFYYWLDFKNLDLDKAEKSGKLLSQYIRSYALEGHVFVESTIAEALRKLKSTEPKIDTIFWLPKNLRNRFTLFQAKYYTVLSGADMISVPAKRADDIFFENFSHLNLAIFTVNDPARAEYFFKKGVRIILTDRDMRSEFPSAYNIQPDL
ncbi:MAG: glycerophosphodiester phosphodiesterase [Nitrospirota bacterium]